MLAEGTIIGTYRVLRKLGEGGMGVVYVGGHTLLGRRAAIKVLLPQLSANNEIVQRFFNEARAVTQIADPAASAPRSSITTQARQGGMTMHDRLDLARRSRSIAAISILALTLIGGGHAHAQSAEAEAMFEQGDKLMTAGKLAEACGAFEASNRIEPRAGTLLRLGECRENNHQLASAWSAYKDSLTRAKDPRKRAAASAKVTELEPKLSYLTISVPTASRVDGLTITRNGKPLDPALWNHALPMDGGDYAISVRAPGNDEWKTTVTVPADGGKLTVDVPKLEQHAEPVGPPIPVVTRPTTPIVSDEVTRPAHFTTRRKIAIGVGGAGAASLVVGIVLGSQARSKQNSALALCPEPQNCADADGANALNDAGYRRALGANILFGVAAAAAIGAGVLWFTGAPETAQHGITVVPSLAPGETGVVVQGRF